ncbi:hypothetical protein EP331_00400 [bacterium]|nr:MAG: hypothetical protein EP331_00400 [bacterium]
MKTKTKKDIGIIKDVPYFISVPDPNNFKDPFQVVSDEERKKIWDGHEFPRYFPHKKEDE